MHDNTKDKTAGQDESPEIIIKQHRRWAHWVDEHHNMGEGSLILTNRRLLFLHRIEASPEVAVSIKKLADAPIETVLNHALTLHKHCLQIPLSSIIKVGIVAFAGFPFPRFHLSVFYLRGKKLTPHMAAFKFTEAGAGILSKPQIIRDLEWKRAVQRVMSETAQTD